MGPKFVIVDNRQKRVILGSCIIEVPIEIKFCSQSTHGVIHSIFTLKWTIVPAYLALPIYIHYIYQIFTAWDYLFESRNINFGIYVHKEKSQISTVLI